MKSKLFESADGSAVAIVWVAYCRFPGIKRVSPDTAHPKSIAGSRPTALEDPVPSLELEGG